MPKPALQALFRNSALQSLSERSRVSRNDEGSNSTDPGNGVVSNRTMNIVVALILMAVAAVVMVASYRLGAGWAKDVGPDSGYFPFYVALIMFFASGVHAAAAPAVARAPTAAASSRAAS